MTEQSASEAQVRKFPAQDERVESGPIQFGDDWPGTFLRGDDSFFYAHWIAILTAALRGEGNHPEVVRPFIAGILTGLGRDLQASNVRSSEETKIRASLEIELEAENMRLRSVLARSGEPCLYCGLPAAMMNTCRSGFPGCARADDMIVDDEQFTKMLNAIPTGEERENGNEESGDTKENQNPDNG